MTNISLFALVVISHVVVVPVVVGASSSSTGDCRYADIEIKNGHVTLLKQCVPCYCSNGQLLCKPRSRCGREIVEKNQNLKVTRTIPSTPIVNLHPKRVYHPIQDSPSKITLVGLKHYRVKRSPIHVCHYNGKVYHNRQYFRRNSCYICQCVFRHFGFSIKCQMDSRCIAQGSMDMCHYHRRYYPLYTRFRKTNCRVCSCKRYHASCYLDKHCAVKSRALPGCSYNGRFYHQNTVVKIGCKTCTCTYSTHNQFYLRCVYSNTCYSSNIYHSSRQHVCIIGNKLYFPGHFFKVDKCRYCQCINREWKCIQSCHSNNVTVPHQQLQHCRFQQRHYDIGSLFRAGCKKCFCLSNGRVSCISQLDCHKPHQNSHERCIWGGKSYPHQHHLLVHLGTQCLSCTCQTSNSFFCEPCSAATLRDHRPRHSRDRGCRYGGKSHPPHDVFGDGFGNTCYCHITGTIKCHLRNTHLILNGAKRTCKFGNARYFVGSSWVDNSCRTCTCALFKSTPRSKCRLIRGSPCSVPSHSTTSKVHYHPLYQSSSHPFHRAVLHHSLANRTCGYRGRYIPHGAQIHITSCLTCTCTNYKGLSKLVCSPQC